MGSDSWRDNYCWPGFSPFYSYFYQYDNNFYYAFTKFAEAIQTLRDLGKTTPGPGYYDEPLSEEEQERTFDGLDFMNISHWLVEHFRQGIEHNSKEMEGAIPRRSMDELSELTSKLMKNKKK